MKKACKSQEAEALCCTILAVLMMGIFVLGSPAWADGSAAPGQSVGRVFLGMEQADVWKILGKPRYNSAVLHSMSRYKEDEWISRTGVLTVVSEQDKVIQVEFDSPNFVTADSLSTQSTLDQIHRRCPSMTAQVYHRVFREPNGVLDGSDECYLDDVRRGIAFTVKVPDQEGDCSDERPYTLIVHRPGRSAVPISDGCWLKPAVADDDPNGVRQLRSWFTPRKGR